jgi:hypothetical protein
MLRAPLRRHRRGRLASRWIGGVAHSNPLGRGHHSLLRYFGALWFGLLIVLGKASARLRTRATCCLRAPRVPTQACRRLRRARRMVIVARGCLALMGRRGMLTRVGGWRTASKGPSSNLHRWRLLAAHFQSFLSREKGEVSKRTARAQQEHGWIGYLGLQLNEVNSIPIRCKDTPASGFSADR